MSLILIGYWKWSPIPKKKKIWEIKKVNEEFIWEELAFYGWNDKKEMQEKIVYKKVSEFFSNFLR